MKSLTSKKTTSRLAAVQAIYSIDIKNYDKGASELAQEIIAYYTNENKEEDIENEFFSEELDQKYLSKLLTHIIDNIEEIDILIAKYLVEGRKITSLNVILKSILRAGVCELKYFNNIPPKVAINEYTTLSKEFCSISEIGFINSILDKIASDVRI